MNNRINELAIQAGLVPDVSGKWLKSEGLEKFAELIIEDCRNVLTDVYRATPIEICGPLLTLDHTLVLHFYDKGYEK